MGSPGVVDFFLRFYLKVNSMIGSFKLHSCLRPYHGEITGSRLISKVKHRRAQSCRYCGDSKKSYSGFHWDYRKYVGDSGGFPKKVAKSCGDSIRILKKGVIGLHGDSKNKLSGFHLDYRKFVQGSIRIL